MLCIINVRLPYVVFKEYKNLKSGLLVKQTVLFSNTVANVYYTEPKKMKKVHGDFFLPLKFILLCIFFDKSLPKRLYLYFLEKSMYDLWEQHHETSKFGI
jgi:hypothetical protein